MRTKAIALIALTATLVGVSAGLCSAASPDLQVWTNSAPASATRGNSISVSDVTTNASTLASAGASTTYLYVHTNLNVSSITPVGTHSVSAMGPRGKVTWSGAVTVPVGQPLGTNYFITVCDKPNNVTESNENNNTNKCVIIINP